MPGNLAGKVAIVTGGSRGLGAAIVRLLVSEGADVIFTYANSETRAKELVKDLQSRGSNALALRIDHGKAAQANTLIDTVMGRFGRLDILVANAGQLLPGIIGGPLEAEGSIDEQYAVNVTGAIAIIRAASRVMGEGGRIVAIGSALASHVGFPAVADYVATKTALAGYCKGAARDLAGRGITVNVLQPGFIDTDMLAPFASLKETFDAAIPLGRYATPEEIALGVGFLVRNDATYVTGAVLNIDGGLSA
ncbi:SDR family oxidoreductase [Starkeya sp. ORNL1]|uniref:SDR family NAD(P)-dependent oxidoreductase n=1 Tax=Starkeya sp. ORNL1 TaxID=2709380 RepID=UPI001463A419|nr:SDR family oxidoreductase [Starkeya sp. ORNL1]QJP13458.1 SDR family oxidoreductase [Starkeya sp. ORNL1]